MKTNIFQAMGFVSACGDWSDMTQYLLSCSQTPYPEICKASIRSSLL
uniref:Uncharacterized protein n=1 Tax=Nelumbo nucifera TaxID=4432 RepID=A0A822YHZ6_NELNU|nr:TPA_asm: hypothetical protein HUJ06_010988 [Nelumbo nucifera]